MKLDANYCIKQFEKIGFEVLIEGKNKFVKLSLLDALRFSLIQGSCFLNNCVGTTLKGRSEVFVHRALFQNDSLIYSPGLFGRDINGSLCEGNSLFYLNKKFPEIFKGTHKYIYLIQLGKYERSNQEDKYYTYFSNLYRQNNKDCYNPNNIILFKISDNGSNLEPFFEYLTSVYFHREGFVTENQVPWFQQKYNLNGKMINGGIPDFSAFHYTFLEQLSKARLFSKGMPIEEFGLCFFKGTATQESHMYKYDLKIGEVKINKSSKPQIIKQLNQYNQAKLSNELFGIIPNEIQGFENFGLINFIDGLKYVKKEIKDVDATLRTKDDIWLKIYTKIVLLSNFDIKIVKEYIAQETGVSLQKITSKELLKCAINSDDNSFITFVKRHL